MASVWKKVLTRGTVIPSDLTGTDGGSAQILSTTGSDVFSWITQITGDITGVTTVSGCGITGGVTSGSANLALDVNASTFTIDGTNDKIMVYDADNAVWGTTFQDTLAPVRAITAGNLIDVTGAGTTKSVAVDLTELTDMTQTFVGADEFVVLDGGSSQKRKPASEIPLSAFSNDSGFASGDITAVVAGTGLNGGATSGSATVNVDTTQAIDNLSGSLTIDDNLTVSGNTTITGNMTVSGTTTTVDSTVITMKDNALEINSNSGAENVANCDSGIIAQTDTGGANIIAWDDSDGRWHVCTGLSTTAISGDQGRLATFQYTGGAPSGSTVGNGLGSFYIDSATDILYIRVTDSGAG